MKKKYSLPKLLYNYKDLEPYISELQLSIHHEKHHLNYVNTANKILDKLDNLKDIDIKSNLKELSFNLSGHKLHSLFWENISPKKQNKLNLPQSNLNKIIKKDFKSFKRFKELFNQAALSLEGSGWVCLVYDSEIQKLIIMQIEKHNLNIHLNCKIIMALDLWEHAYYLDYKNNKMKFVESFWNIVNWQKINQRLNDY